MSDLSIAFAQERIPGPGGKEYLLLPVSYGARRDYCTHLEKTALEAIRRNKDAYGPVEFKSAMREFALSVAGGAFEWGKQVFLDSLDCDERLEELCWIVLRQDGVPDAQRAMSRDEFSALWNMPDKWANPDTGKEDDCIRGRNIWLKLWEFIKRPNLPRPEAAPGAT